MPTRNVSLTPHFDSFINREVKSGRFSNASEVVRESLRLLEQREQEEQAKLDWLRGAITAGFNGIASGSSVAVDSELGLDTLLDAAFKEGSQATRAEAKGWLKKNVSA